MREGLRRRARTGLLLPALLGALWAPAGAAVDAGIGASTAGSPRPEAAVEADRAGAASARWAGAAALKERIEGEIVELEALAAAQDTLIEWNRSRAEIGLAPAGLSREVCLGQALEAWCPLLPATFGADGAGGWADGGR